ncbi:hypothetical protein [Streptococcus thoraltensis]|uniref:hypothetical protein n=1 Tax=Streptococcus thoraltensis TaxID=55085 RepID=UPI00037ACA11|nr:hypothetical protein [Streptococcus thoraltensis]MDY4761350.1 hypothetical protein [Streptococcus thoraltensis]
MLNNKKIFTVALLGAFFLGILGGRYRQETVLKDSQKAFQVTAENKQNGEEVLFQVQRFDQKRLKIQLSTGEVFSSQLSNQRENGAWIIQLPNEDGKLALQPSILPWREARLGVLTSRKYQEKPGTSKVVPHTEVTPLTENDLTGAEPAADTTVRSQVQLTSRQVDQMVSDFGDWLVNSSYAKHAVVVRGAFNEAFSNSSGPVGILAFEVDSLKILAGLSGDDMTGFESLDSDIQSYTTSLVDIDQSGKELSDFQSQATFRVYRTKSQDTGYYQSAKEEREALGISTYSDFYQNRVDQEADSLSIVLANNGRVYYAKDYGMAGQTTYLEAPNQLQRAYNQFLAQYRKT